MNSLVFYVLGVLILVLAGFFVFSKNTCSDLLNIMAGTDAIYSSDVPSVKKNEVSFNQSFLTDSRFLKLRDDWLAPTSFAELTSTSSAIKKSIDFKIGNPQLFGTSTDAVPAN